MTATIESTDIPTQSTLPRSPLGRIADDGEALYVAARLAARFARGAAERDAHRRLPFPELAALSRTGLLGITAPRPLGGADVSVRTLVEVHRLIAAADPSIAQIIRSHFACLQAVRQRGSAAQQRFLFGEALEGRRFALAEKDGGDRTVVTSTSDGMVRVDGVKRRATGVVLAHWIGVHAAGSGAHWTAFVSAEAPGVLSIDDWAGVGLRTSASGSVQLSGVRAAKGHMVRTEGRPGGPVTALLGAAIGVGIAAGAVDDATRLLDHDADPLLVNGFGEIYLLVRGAEAVLAGAAEALDAAPSEGSSDGELAVASARALGIRVAAEVTGALHDLVGARIEPDQSTLHRHWREARANGVLDPAHDAVAVVGRRALRTSA